MARRPEGPKLKWPDGIVGSGIARVRFTFKARRYDESTGTSDPVEAEDCALRIYADVIQGRVKRVEGTLVHPGTDLAEVWTKWLAAVSPSLGPKTGRTYEVYGRHICRAMPTVGELTDANLGRYQMARLSVVTRETLVKHEQPAARAFFRWAAREGYLSMMPAWPELPKAAAGVRHAMGRKAPTLVLLPAEVEAIIAAHDEPDFFIVAWETALRPDSTIPRLLPSDLLPGQKLSIRAEVDKVRRARVIPVTERAYAALRRSLPFGERDRLEGFKTAVRRALGRDRDHTIYDLKHARITAWVDEGRPLGGISKLTGVSIETLTKRYAHASDAAAEEIILGEFRGEKEESNVIPLFKSDPSVGTTPRPGSENTGESYARKRPNRSKKTASGHHSGNLPQNDPSAEVLAFRAKAAAWFKRGAA
jgi:integrase